MEGKGKGAGGGEPKETQGSKADGKARSAEVPPKSAKGAPRGKKSPKGASDLRGDLLTELGHLRPTLTAISEALHTRLDARVAEFMALFEGAPGGGDGSPTPGPRVQARLLSSLRGLKVKPKKGRVKDLQRVETLLDRLSEILSPKV